VNYGTVNDDVVQSVVQMSIPPKQAKLQQWRLGLSYSTSSLSGLLRKDLCKFGCRSARQAGSAMWWNGARDYRLRTFKRLISISLIAVTNHDRVSEAAGQFAS
jgi:hypothetical protein